MYIHKYTLDVGAEMKNVIRRQYQEIVDTAASAVSGLSVPKEGWIRTMREALGMSGAALGRRMDITRQHLAQHERNEIEGVITLKTLNELANAMNCRLVYAFVPETSAKEMIAARAHDKARQIVEETSTHMALEAQTPDEKSLEREVKRLQDELIRKMPATLWDDE